MFGDGANINNLPLVSSRLRVSRRLDTRRSFSERTVVAHVDSGSLHQLCGEERLAGHGLLCGLTRQTPEVIEVLLDGRATADRFRCSTCGRYFAGGGFRKSRCGCSWSRSSGLPP